MDYLEAKAKFIQAWGSLGSSWGINRTMAQIHALLLLATQPLSTEDMMEELKISRGNANMNIRALIDWGLVQKEFIPGERKEFFSAKKETWEIARQIAKERKKRELEPQLGVLHQLQSVEGENEQVEEFKKVTHALNAFAKQSESILNLFIGANSSWFFRVINKLKS